MERIRAFTPDDIPAVVALHGRAFGRSPALGESELARLFDELFFRGPWREQSFPSLVFEHDGRPAAFIGVLPRRMELNGQPIWLVVTTQLMVDPERRVGLAAIQLLKQVFAGKQDLVLTDGASETVRRIWLQCGGASVPLYDLHWRRTIRPARRLLDRAGQKGRVLKLGAALLRPAAAAVDAVAGRLPLLGIRAAAGLTEESLTIEPLVDEFSSLRDRVALVPLYDRDSLSWLLRQVEQKRRHGPLRARLLRSDGGAVCGWYLCYVTRGGSAEVIQLYARRGWEAKVVAHLFHTLLREGVVAAGGRYDPMLAQALSDARAVFVREGPLMLCHTHRSDLMAAVQGGSAFLTRLEAEWWMRFIGG